MTDIDKPVQMFCVSGNFLIVLKKEEIWKYLPAERKTNEKLDAIWVT